MTDTNYIIIIIIIIIIRIIRIIIKIEGIDAELKG